MRNSDLNQVSRYHDTVTNEEHECFVQFVFDICFLKSVFRICHFLSIIRSCRAAPPVPRWGVGVGRGGFGKILDNLKFSEFVKMIKLEAIQNDPGCFSYSIMSIRAAQPSQSPILKEREL